MIKQCKLSTVIAMAMGLSAIGLAPGVQADIVQNDDVIVEGGVCASRGSACADLEDFLVPGLGGSTAYKNKDSFPRIWFDDTSAGDSDWAIQIDDGIATAAEVAEGFHIYNIEANTTPFIIENGSGNNLLYLDADEHIGVNTNVPSHTVHAIGDRIRLQNGVKDIYMRADGTDTDIEAVGADLYLRSSTTGKNIIVNPFPNDGNVGIGAFFAAPPPTAPLHVRRTDGTANVLVEETNGTILAREMFKLTNNGGPFFVFADSSLAQSWSFAMGATGDFIQSHQQTAGVQFRINPNGNATLAGTLTQNSSRAAKHGIEAIDAQAVLDKVMALPISEWTYKHDKNGIRHVGPMAEDFADAFGLGATDTGISTMDTSGVALAAIQGLHEQVQQKETELEALRQEKDAEIDALTQRLENLERLMLGE